MKEISKSKALFAQAQNAIPGGVNSPVRAFKAVGGDPLFISRAEGPYLYDADGNEYIELINSWGPMILGHNHPVIREAVSQAVAGSLSFGAPTQMEVEMAEQIVSMVPGIEKVRMVNSGTEATMSAIRVARGYTGRDKIIKITGCYHGHGDSFLIAAGSGAMTMGSPDSPGVTKGTAQDTLLAPYNDLEAIKALLEANQGQVAALIIEPVPGNMGLIIPVAGYLQGLRELCDSHQTVLIFDEVMTGFRLAAGGAQELFGVQADMTTLGKIIGGGMPVGAYGGRAEIMNYVSPQGPVYQAGTLSGNPVAMAAGLAMLRMLQKDPAVYTRLNEKTSRVASGIQQNLDALGLPFTSKQLGSMYTLFFSDEEVHNFEDAKACDTALFGKYFREMLQEGIYLPPSQFESLFLSDALQDEHIEAIIKANKTALERVMAK